MSCVVSQDGPIYKPGENFIFIFCPVLIIFVSIMVITSFQFDSRAKSFVSFVLKELGFVHCWDCYFLHGQQACSHINPQRVAIKSLY